MNQAVRRDEPGGSRQSASEALLSGPARGFHDIQARRAKLRSGQPVAIFSCVNRERKGGPKEATMKRLTNCIATAVAALIVTAGVASAQNVLKAEVPFAFHVGSKVVEPGTIHVGMLSGINGGRAILVNNYAARRSYIVLPKLVGDAPKSWVASGEPKLGFDCSMGVCVLAQFWTGQGYAYSFHGPKTKAGETMLTEIVMKPDKAD
jgi:hypothetical protein